MHAIAKQFPWAKPQKDGTYGFMIFRASCNLLGSGREFGWWTQEPCCGDKSRYISGFHLLEEEHLSDSAGWILPPAQTPWLDFTFGLGKPPTSPPPTEHSWSEYYQWRGLPLSSPAALLLHWPLSVYRLLHLLGFAAQRPPKRRFLTVYLLGIETEVNFLPIFGELALLLPNTDLDLVLFGTGVSTLLAKAVSKPFCLASRPFAYTYKAPEESGGGSIRIELSRCGPYYEASNLSALRREKPDALVALNAGLSTYDEWLQVYFASRALAIPFGVTEYGEVSLSVDIVNLRQLPFAGMTRFSHWALTPEERSRIAATPNATFPIEMNPFMYPGPRAQAVQSGPTSYNGYTFVVTPGARP
ncbi:hypothetical protein DXG01_010394 [Tephrocybe rancida]|nr:hypothetical protein DXG01_010394 [Tephrocybe rancida]